MADDDGGGREESASRGAAGEDGDGNFAAAAQGGEIVNDHAAANRPPRSSEVLEVATPKFGDAGRVASMNLSVDITSPTMGVGGGINSLPVGMLSSPGSNNSQVGEQSSDTTTPQDGASKGGRRGSTRWTATTPPDGEAFRRVISSEDLLTKMLCDTPKVVESPPTVTGKTKLSKKCRRISMSLMESMESVERRSSPTMSVKEKNATPEIPQGHEFTAKAMERIVYWVFAGQQFKQKSSVMQKHEEKREYYRNPWTSDAMGLIITCIVTVALCTAGGMYCLLLGLSSAASVLFVHASTLVVSVLFMRTCHESGLMGIETSFAWFRFLQTFLIIATPSAMTLMLGGVVASGEAMLYMSFAPMLCLFLFKRQEGDLNMGKSFKMAEENPFSSPIKASGNSSKTLGDWPAWRAMIFLVIVRSSITVILLYFDRELALLVGAVGHLPRLEALVSACLAYIITPAAVIVCSRHMAFEYYLRSRAMVKSNAQLLKQQLRTERLVHSLVPSFKVGALRSVPPKDWSSVAGQDDFEDCTIIQMDIAGFTQMASELEPVELIDILNVFFMHIDQASVYIGNIWKVETIGDSYICVAGGPEHHQCLDHAERGALLGCCMVEIAKEISMVTGINLKVRVGIHSGDVTAAVVGKVFPRCLIFGADCLIAHLMETSSEAGRVNVSSASATQLTTAGWSDYLTRNATMTTARGDKVETYLIDLELAREQQALGEVDEVLIDLKLRLGSMFAGPGKSSLAGTSASSKVWLAGAWKSRVFSATFAATEELKNRILEEDWSGIKRTRSDSLRIRRTQRSGNAASASNSPLPLRPVERRRFSEDAIDAASMQRYLSESDAGNARLHLDGGASETTRENGGHDMSHGEFKRVESADRHLEPPPIVDDGDNDVKISGDMRTSSDTTNGSKMSEGSDGSDNDDVNGKANRIDPKAQVAANVRKVAFGGSTSHGGDDHDGSDIVFEQAQDVTSKSGYGKSAFDDAVEGATSTNHKLTPSKGSFMGLVGRMFTFGSVNPQKIIRKLDTAAEKLDMMINEDDYSPAYDRFSKRRQQFEYPSRSASFDSMESRRSGDFSQSRTPTSTSSPMARGLGRKRMPKWEEAENRGKKIGRTPSDDTSSSFSSGNMRDHDERMAMPGEREANADNERKVQKVKLRVKVSCIFGMVFGATSLVQALVLFSLANPILGVVPLLLWVLSIIFTYLMIVKGPAWCVAMEVLLLVSPFGLCNFGGGGGFLGRSAVLWSFNGCLLICQLGGHHGEDWKLSFLAYALVVWSVFVLKSGDEHQLELSAWLIHAIHLIVPGSLFLFPMALMSKRLLDDEECDEILFREMFRKIWWEEQLLEALVPPQICARLLNSEKAHKIIADRYDEATVLFVYIEEYSQMCYSYDMKEVIRWLNETFTAMDSVLVKMRKVVKVETFQNLILLVSGCPEKSKDHARYCAAASIALHKAATKVRRPDGQFNTLRIGISSGAISAGVVGAQSPRFSIFGDAVNTASRMASTADVSEKDQMCVHMSTTTATLLNKKFLEKMRKEEGVMLSKMGNGMNIKGKGIMRTFSWRNGRALNVNSGQSSYPIKTPRKMWEEVSISSAENSRDNTSGESNSSEEGESDLPRPSGRYFK